LNPADSLHLLRLSNILGISDVKNLQTTMDRIAKDHLKKLIELIIDLKEDGSNFKSSMTGFAKYIKGDNQIDDENDKKMILDEIDDLLNHWYQYAKKAENKSLHQFKNAMALGQTHPLAQANGVTLSTVHTMKGQEYEIVFIMGMDDETFPDYRAIKSGGLDMIQEKNNAYVAFTRAKRFLFVTFPKKRLMPWGDFKVRRKSTFLKPFETED
jgi:DNA helicase-2/ATP-dependent DNA helicase PcrA